jgi:Flp pilus assembly secretin CpaC
VQILAEPNVLAINGKQAASWQGEFPYPVLQSSTGSGSNAITVPFRQSAHASRSFTNLIRRRSNLQTQQESYTKYSIGSVPMGCLEYTLGHIV